MDPHLWDIQQNLSNRCRRRCNLCPRVLDRKVKMKCLTCCQIVCKVHIRNYCMSCFRNIFNESFIQTTDIKDKQRINALSNCLSRQRCSYCNKRTSKRCCSCDKFLCKNHCHMICLRCVNV